jgi:hypothetical protein
MCLGRLHSRVLRPTFRVSARLPNYRLVFNKHSKDGSGKANVVPTDNVPGVWGAVFELTKPDFDRLAEWEKGYEPLKEVVYRPDGQPVETVTFIADAGPAEKLPYTWYLRHITCGASQWGIEPAYITELSHRPARRDTDRPNREQCEFSFPCDRRLTPAQRAEYQARPCGER